MIGNVARRGDSKPTHIHSPQRASAHARLLVAGLVVALFSGITACAPSGALPAPNAPSPTGASDPVSRIHNATPDYVPLFARITFVPSTTHEQAVVVLGREPYPWQCDDPRTPVPPPLAEQRARFAASHALLISYPAWDELTRIAASPQVVSVDGTALYQCP
jgi:hypothetical protein